MPLSLLLPQLPKSSEVRHQSESQKSKKKNSENPLVVISYGTAFQLALGIEYEYLSRLFHQSRAESSIHLPVSWIRLATLPETVELSCNQLSNNDELHYMFQKTIWQKVAFPMRKKYESDC